MKVRGARKQVVRQGRGTGTGTGTVEVWSAVTSNRSRQPTPVLTSEPGEDLGTTQAKNLWDRRHA